METKQKILILGGKPIGSVDIVEYAKSIGCYTIVCDYLPIDESPAKQIADESWNYSTADVNTIVERAKKENITAVFTGIHEFNIDKCQKIAEILHLPFYATKEQLFLSSDKKAYKALFKKFDVPVVPEYSITKETFDKDVSKVIFPVLVKPSDGSGGYGISICHTVIELKKAFDKALLHSKSKKILVEQFVQAKECTIFYMIQNGKIMLSAMAERHTANGDKDTIALPVLYTFPSEHLDHYQKTLNNKVIRAFESIDLQNGMIFIQSFVNHNGFIFYDIGFRLTGTQEYHLLEKTCGYNPLKMMVDYALTGKMGEKDVTTKVTPNLNGYHASNITFLAKPSIIGRFIGLEEIQSLPGVIKIVKNHLEGEEILLTAVGTLNQVALRIFVITDSREKLIDLIQKIQEKFDILSDKGESILLPTFKI